MEKLSFYGVGPKIGRITLPWLAVTIILTVIFRDIFSFGSTLKQPLLIAGILLIVIALAFYFSTLRLMLPGIKSNTLVTGGAYRLTRNPLYAAILLFLVPGISLAMNSWLVLTTIVVGYLVFNKYIHEEEEILERLFGDEFRNYRDRTSRLFPNPFSKKN